MAEADGLRERYAEAERLMREAEQALRGAVPPELSRQLADAVRELLIALRAVLDWYIARLEPPERAPADVQDIPVE